MARLQKNVKEKKKVNTSPFKDYWSKSNYLFLAIGLSVLILGYYLMTQGSWNSTSSLSISPIVLLIVYLVLIPLSIFFKLPSRKKKETTDVSSKN